MLILIQKESVFSINYSFSHPNTNLSVVHLKNKKNFLATYKVHLQETEFLLNQKLNGDHFRTVTE